MSAFKASSKNIKWIICLLVFTAAFQIHSGRISHGRFYKLHVLKWSKVKIFRVGHFRSIQNWIFSSLFEISVIVDVERAKLVQCLILLKSYWWLLKAKPLVFLNNFRWQGNLSYCHMASHKIKVNMGIVIKIYPEQIWNCQRQSKVQAFCKSQYALSALKLS